MFENIEFANPKLLWLLLLVPLAIIWYILRHKKQEASVTFSDLKGMVKLPRTWKAWFRHLLFGLKMAALALLIVALARPQSSSTNSTSNIEGIDIVMAMDVSGSMLARDLKPDRLTAAKEVASNFVKDRPGDRMGLVIFSGETFTQVPLTTDHGVMLNMLAEMKNGLIEDGTAIGDGLATAISRLKDSEAISKVIILLTDGMNNAGSVDPYTAAEIAKLYGIRVYTIGVGTYGMAPYPAKTPFGTTVMQQIKVEIDEKLLTTIANSTGGKYFRANNNKKLDEIYQEIDKLERSKIEVTEFRRLHEEFYPLVAWALALLLLEFLLRKTIFRTLTD
ncbi:MAG: VWA domain-containing protein [Bacteroidales bacterium]|jgi:Ca-activated chloride channel family protein|nr:VWA domain-containing protein [Bacteroidales bacterium]